MKTQQPLLAAILLAAAGAVGIMLVRRGPPLRRFAVEGDSMLPAFRAGDHVLVNAWAYRRDPPQVDDVVVARDPDEPARWLVKRVAAAPDVDGRITILGDNPLRSRDSRTFGPVDSAAIAGKVVYRY